MSPWWYFGLTLLLEAPVVGLFYRRRWREAVVPFFLLNLFTWPLLHYLMLTTRIPVWQLETGIWLTEGTGYALLLKTPAPRALLVSGLANGLSYGTGLILNHYIY